jgi:hypothetical protein
MLPGVQCGSGTWPWSRYEQWPWIVPVTWPGSWTFFSPGPEDAGDAAAADTENATTARDAARAATEERINLVTGEA